MLNEMSYYPLVISTLRSLILRYRFSFLGQKFYVRVSLFTYYALLVYTVVDASERITRVLVYR